MAKRSLSVMHNAAEIYSGRGELQDDRQRHFGSWTVILRLTPPDHIQFRRLLAEEVTVTIGTWHGTAYVSDAPLSGGPVRLVGIGAPPGDAD
jgi:hypothetical protein